MNIYDPIRIAINIINEYQYIDIGPNSISTGFIKSNLLIYGYFLLKFFLDTFLYMILLLLLLGLGFL